MKLRKACLFVAALAAFATSAAADERLDRLSEDERGWLEEEVVYIISPNEREVFLNLETREERERFAQAFWDRRDPNPATLANEFMDEHYRRFEYAVRVLGRDAPRPGWKTDRGKYYIILGEPAEIQTYLGGNEVVDAELWLYNGEPEYGLPARFNLLFYRENNIGEYQLYHPHSDGPEALLHDGFNLRTNQNIALDYLETISIDLAKAALTVDLNEPTASMFQARNSRDPMLLQVRPSMAVNRNLADIEEYPLEKVDTDYLQGYLTYGNRVTSDYSFNYVDSRSAFAVFIGPDNTPFVHFSIELDPENLTLEANDEKTEFYTTLHVSLELRSPNGQLLAVSENQPFLRVNRSQFDVAATYPFAYRDSFPVLPGDYRISVILRNRATKQYTVAEAEVSAPATTEALALSELVLAGKLAQAVDAAEGEHETFELGGMEIDPVTQPVYALDSTLHVAAQLVNGSLDHEIRFSVFPADATEPVATEQGEILVTGAGLVSGEVPLMGLPAGDYRLQGELLDGEGRVEATREKPFQISPRTSIARAGIVYRHSFSADVPGLLDMTLGEQLMVRGRIDEAEQRLRLAVAAGNPQLPMAQWKLASAVLFKRGADEALALLKPLEETYGDQVEVVEGLGFAYYIKQDHASALPYLEEAKTLRPPDTSLLNAIGDCYETLQQPDKAKEAFELSLQLNPEQAGVKARLAGLTE